MTAVAMLKPYGVLRRGITTRRKVSTIVSWLWFAKYAFRNRGRRAIIPLGGREFHSVPVPILTVKHDGLMWCE